MLPDTHPSSVRAGRDRPAEDADQPVPDRWDATDEPAPVDPDDGPGDQAGTGLPEPEGDQAPYGWEPFPGPDGTDGPAGDLPFGWRDESEAYRPWFMGGEPATPWFAAPDS